MNVFFSSLESGRQLKSRLLQSLEYAEQLASTGYIEIHIMIFSFTDVSIYKSLVKLAKQHRCIVIRIIADWNQGSKQAGRVIPHFLELNIKNIEIRFKYDTPYIWDDSAQCLRWSYHASLGLLHHKTLCILKNCVPKHMIAGSMNWTKNSERVYENIIEFDDTCLSDTQIMNRFELEFRALWENPFLTVSPELSKRIYSETFFSKANKKTIISPHMTSYEENISPFINHPKLQIINDDNCQIAFSSNIPFQSRSTHGYDKNNNKQSFYVEAKNNKMKKFQLSLQSLTLDTILRAKNGDELFVAMYAFSNRVPEYSAILNAARKGVQVYALLDKKIGPNTKEKMNALSKKENLNLTAVTSNKRMHQKYLIHKDSFTVVTGTANMTRDAYERHAEHRIRWSHNEKVATAFLKDFFTIKSSSNY